MIFYELEKNEGNFNFKSKEQALLELVVVSNAVLQIFDTEGVSDKELKELYTNVCRKYGVSLDCRLFNVANEMAVEVLNCLLQREEGEEG